MTGGADEFLDELVRRLHEPDAPDVAVCLDVGCGALEDLLRDREEELWSRIVQLATDDVRFRRALSCVWASESSRYEDRKRLLEDLGEFWSEEVRLIAFREDFGDEAPLGWRAFSRNGQVSNVELAALLRSVADHVEAGENHVKAPRVGISEREKHGPWHSPEAVVRSFLEPSAVATWAVRQQGDLAVGIVVPRRDPSLVLWMPCSSSDDGEWRRWQVRSRVGWQRDPDGDRGIYFEQLDDVAEDVELVHVRVPGQGLSDVEPVAGHVFIVHWNVSQDFSPPRTQVIAHRQRSHWDPVPPDSSP